MSFNPAGGNISGANDVALNNPADNHVLTYNGALAKWQNEAIPIGSGSYPYLVTPASSSQDIGPLINTALQTYGAAVVAANPTGYWTCNTPIQIGTNEALIGFGQSGSRIQCGASFPTGQPLVGMRTGSSAHFTISNLHLNANGRASEAIGLRATAAPDSTARTSPDYVSLIENIHARGATGDGIYIGGTSAYSGNLRETRVRNCLVVANGGWGLTIASSDMFVSDVTAHGNGPGGIRLVSGQSGNTKLMQCKAYFETVGIQSESVRVTITGGEVQDCNTGVVLGADSYLACTICSCGDASNGAIRTAGGGSTFAVHMTSRFLASQPSTMDYAVQIGSSTQILGGFINTNVATGKYANMYLGATRPNAASNIQIY